MRGPLPMRPCFATVLALLAGLGATAVPAAGQSLSRGILDGLVTDTTGLPLNAVSVALVNSVTGQRHSLRTSRTGRFTTGFITPGVYDATVEGLGYQPERLEGILVRPGERRELTITLTTGSGGPQTRRVGAGSAAASASADPSWLVGTMVAPLPLEGGDLSVLSALATTTAEGLAPLGLPSGFTTPMVNGVPLLNRPRGFGLRPGTEGLPLSAFQLASVLLFTPDVEWHPATSHLAAYTRRGGNRTRFAGWGEWSGDALPAAADAAPFNAMRAGGILGGAIARDTADFLIGFEYARETTPLGAIWTDTSAARLAQTALQQHDLNLSSYTNPTVRRTERFSGFGTAEYQITRDNILGVNAMFTSLPRVDALRPGAHISEYAVRRDGVDLMASGQLATRFSDGTLNEFYVGFETSRFDREQDPGLGAAITIPGTAIAENGLEFGSANTLPTSYRHRSLYARESANIQRGDHIFKVGVSAQLSWYDFGYDRGLAGEFFFSGVNDFANGMGAFRQTVNAPTDYKLYLRRYSFFAQDRWTVRSGFEILAGARYALVILPDTGNLPVEGTWRILAEMQSNALPSNIGEVEPRFGLTWNPGNRNQWLMAASLAVSAETIESADLEELWANRGELRGRETLNSAGSYPNVPNLGVAGALGRSLSLFGPEFRTPVSTVGGFSITRFIGGAAIGVAVVNRKTNFLPQRRDLNLLPSEVARDQNGRIIHGTLVKQGATLIAAPRSNRRFSDMDRVWVIEATGTSSYSGVTISIDRRPGRGIGFFANYTYSETTDDWLRARDAYDDVHVSPFQFDPANRNWIDGRSDFDVPHRLSVGAELRAAGRFAPTIAALFRHRSGDPFTPGFRAGVDMNGDGLSRNDPAFVDGSVPGAAEVIAAHDCLSSQVGRIAERNACRTDNVRSLDARLSFAVMQNPNYSAHIVVDALNLIGSETGIVDRALYLVDPTRNLVTDAASGIVNVPLIANPNFGRFVARYKPDRVLRLGLRVSY